jgi:hypothetical protein
VAVPHPLRIVAIDPGPVDSAVVVYMPEGKVPTFHLKAPNHDLLTVLWDLGGVQPADTVCVVEEMTSYGLTAGRSMFQTCVWAGRFAQHWKTRTGREVNWLPRPAIKVQLCGTPRAKDRDVREELIHRFGEPGTKKAPGVTYGFAGDTWAALAVSVAYAELERVSP